MSRNTEKIYRKQSLETFSPLVDDYIFYASETEKMVTVLIHILTTRLGIEDNDDLVDIISRKDRQELIKWIDGLFKKKMNVIINL